MPLMIGGASGTAVVFGRRRVSGGGVVTPPGPTTDSNITALRSTGWDVDYTSPPTFDPVADPKYLVLTRQGYDSNGSPTTFTKNVRLTKRVRQVYPNDASLDATRVALETQVYATDTIVGSVTGSTAVVSPTPVANWARGVMRACVGNTLPKEYLEIVAFHKDATGGKQVACVEWTISSGGTTLPTVKSSAMVISGRATDKNPVLVYRPAADIDISSLADAATVTVNAKVYPLVGGSASILDTSTYVGTDKRRFQPLLFWKHVTRVATPPIAYVALAADAGNGVGTPTTAGIVSTDLATAKATPFTRLKEAIEAIRTAHPTLGVDGAMIVLQKGTHTDITTTTTGVTYQFGNSPLTITRDTSDGTATKANTIFSPTANWQLRCYQFRLHGITFKRTVAAQMASTTAGGLLIFDDADFDGGSVSGGLASGATITVYVDGMTATGVASNVFSPAAGNILGLSRGISGVGVSGFFVEPSTIVGCLFEGGRASTTARTTNGGIIAFNKWLKVPNTVAVLDASHSNTDTGCALVQNVVEFISATSNPSVRLSGDDETVNTNHVVLFNNTAAGWGIHGRNNNFYDETTGVNRSHINIADRGNIWVQMNTKHDTFHAVTQPADAPNHIGAWSYLYGVDCAGNLEQYTPPAPATESQAYFGAGSKPGTGATSRTAANDPGFANHQANTSASAATGGGTYTIGLTSPAKGILESAVLPYDLAGVARALTSDDAGAYKAA